MPGGPGEQRSARFVRVAEQGRVAVTLSVDGRPVQALQGDTLMVALLTTGLRLRDSEFGDGPRAGFCLMGACQDCWVWAEDGQRLRACSTPVAEGLRVCTTPPAVHWPRTPDLAERLAARVDDGPSRG
jgi:predicted molibdopterin-dependent oxidoreductase YjgC